jgi:hypothetical protein
MSYNPQNPNGQAAMANSSPVVVASDQTAIPVSATSLPLPTGAATAVDQTNGSQKTQIVDASGNVIGSTSGSLDVNISGGTVTGSENVSQIGGSNTVAAGVNGTLATGGNQAAGSTISTNTNPLLIAGSDYGTTAKLQSLKVDSSGNAQVAVTNSPTVTANIGTTNGLVLDATVTGGNAKVQGNVSSGTADSGNPVKVGGIYNSSAPSLTTGQRSDLQVDGSGNLKVNIASGGSSTAATTDEATWTAGASNFAPTGGVYNDSAATLTAGQQGAARVTTYRGLHTNLRNSSGTELATASNPLQVSLANSATNATPVKVDGSGVTQPVSGTVSVTALPVGTNSIGTVGLNAGTNTIGGVELIDSGGTNKLSINGSGQAAVTPTGGDLTSGSQVTKLSDGTNTANVGLGDANNAFVYTGPGHLTQTFSISSVTAGTSYDAGNYRWVSVQFTAVGGATSSTTFQISNDNANFTSTALTSAGAVAVNATTTATATSGVGIYHGPLAGRYFRLNVTTLPSGTVAGTIIFSSQPTALAAFGVAVSQQTANWASNVSQFGGTAVSTGTGASGTGIPRVTVSNDSNVLATLQPSATSVGWSAYAFPNSTITAGLSNTAVSVKSSVGQFGGYMVYNPNSLVSYVQIFNTASVTVGTTAPVLIIPIPPGAAANIEFANGVTFSTAIYAAATTTPTGNTAPTTALSGFFLYK